MDLAAAVPDQLATTATTPTSSGPFADVIGLVPAWLQDALLSLLVLLAGYLLSRAIVALVAQRIARRFKRPSLTRMALRGIRLSVFVLAGLTILRIYGLSLGGIALSVTVFSAVVGVILAPVVGSIISGVFLLADQPYEIGDMIEISDTGQRGFVDDITLRYTKIFTMDNTFLVVPNGAMRDRDVVNFSAEDPRTRRSVRVLVTYESDVDLARDLIEKGTRQLEEVISGGPNIRIGAARYPAAPTCYVDEFGDHGILLTLRYWMKEPYKPLTVRSKINDAIWDAFDGEDVEIAYPHSHLVFDETSGELPISVSRGHREGETSHSVDEFGE